MKSGLLAHSNSMLGAPPSDANIGASIPAPLRALPAADIAFRVLVLESESPHDTLLADVVHAELPDADVIRTAGPLGALALAHIHSFNLLVVDCPMMVDVQIELLEAFVEHNPDAEVILSAGKFVSPGTRGPRIHVVTQPVNPLELLELVRECRARTVGFKPGTIDTDEQEDGHFVVVLHRHTPIEVVQFKCLAGATTVLDFIQRNGPGGRVWFERGEVSHAETATLRGEAALIDMINWPGGSIVEVIAPRPIERTINMPWQSLLMYAAHAADERRAAALTA